MPHENRLIPSTPVNFKQKKADLKKHIESLDEALVEAAEKDWIHHMIIVSDQRDVLQSIYDSIPEGDNENVTKNS